ncbi:uncharacterized protein LOC133900791 [Phragmites australis]|uniref:uncharacterized protein LOC133900791 n=1 Tax=Phragmites australis TaxID=29695 RepID=UPI002D76A048|nr:uncharacterized protein LOC133900791 [Phragmites australis]
MELGLGCFGAPAGRKVSPAARQSGGGEGQEAKQQQVLQVKAPSGLGEEKMGGEPAKVAAAGRKEKKWDHRKAPLVMHQFPFHSRPGLL